MLYTIHEDNMPKLTAKLATIQKKCIKHNCQFKFAEIGEEFKEVQHEKVVTGAYGTQEKIKTCTAIERFVIVEVEGIAKINNWQFVATIQHTENGNIIRKYLRDVEVSESYRTVKPICEHCKSSRMRKDTYLVQNIETGEIKQVGKSCLKEYTNGLSAEMVALYCSYFDTVEGINEKESMGGYTRRYLETFDFLLHCSETIKKCGFVSAGKAQENPELIKTSSKVLDFMNPWNQCIRQEMEHIDYDSDTEENKKTVKNALKWIMAADTTNDYIYNLQTACKAEYTEFRNAGILASLIPAYHKAMESEEQKRQREEKNANNSQSQFIGNIKDKITITGTGKCIASYETEYGYTHIYQFIDATGNVYIWKTANNPLGDNSEVESITIKGTVKEHTEFRGVKQTVLTRCKVLI